jgi:hypothetical protein
VLFVPWFDFLDLSKVSDEDRFRVLEYAVSKHGRARVQEVLGVSRITMWRLLSRQARVDNDKLRALLSLITQREFENLVSARDRLKALGVLRDDAKKTRTILGVYSGLAVAIVASYYWLPSYVFVGVLLVALATILATAKYKVCSKYEVKKLF